MFKSVSTIFISLVLVFSLTALTGCDTEDPVDFTVLEAAIADAQELYDTTEQGSLPGQFPESARTTLSAAIDVAETVRNTETVTQIEVDSAVTTLQAAMDTYNALIIGQIQPDNLMLYLPFNGNSNDESGNGFHGVPKAGHIDFGAGDPPSLTTDRFGNDNGAYHFDNGGNIEVPYDQKLNPEEAITISLWFNIDNSDEKYKSIVMALSRNFGYMMQISSNYLYTTFYCMNEQGDEVNNDEIITDYPIHAGEWNHYAVSYTDKSMKFYMNGVLTASFDDKDGDMIPVEDQIPLSIGSDLPTGTYTTSDGNRYFVGYGGFFTGEIDDLRIYDMQLADSDVSAIYNMEKPQ